jgi:ATP-dependent 26S proteasome regulatory subunit
MMISIIILKFGPSPSRYYKKALEIAQNFGNTKFTENPKACTIEMSAHEFIKKQSLFLDLHKLIRNWNSSKFYLNDKILTPFKLIPQKTKLVTFCAKSYSNYKDHCQINEFIEGWGCIHLEKIKLHLMQEPDIRNDEEYWYKFGKFKNKNTWQIDKSRIKSIINLEIDQKYLQFCPFFSVDKIEEKINALPYHIDLLNNLSWEIETIKDFENDEIAEKPIGLIHARDEIPEYDRETSQSKYQQTQLGQKKSKSEKVSRRKRFIPSVKFEDIGGIDSIIEKIHEVIELPILQPELFEHLGIQAHKGIILYGPPGTGKTLIAKAIANEINAHFILVNGPEIVSKWVGKSEKNLREIFDEANDYSPSIIFFDEIDAIASKRSGSESPRYAAQIVNQLLTLFDGVTENKGVVIMASTNRIELLDPAILRPGRFDYKIEIPNPNLEGCLSILQLKAKKIPLEKSFNMQNFSKKLYGLSGAEITFVVNEAAYNALRRSFNIKDSIKMKVKQNLDQIIVETRDFDKAIETLKAEKQTNTRIGF